MFKMVECSEKTYDRLSRVCRFSGGMSQEDLLFAGIKMASMQPNMIADPLARIREPDFFWCRRFLKWFF